MTRRATARGCFDYPNHFQQMRPDALLQRSDGLVQRMRWGHRLLDAARDSAAEWRSQNRGAELSNSFIEDTAPPVNAA